jgi:hypothetical protein
MFTRSSSGPGSAGKAGASSRLGGAICDEGDIGVMVGAPVLPARSLPKTAIVVIKPVTRH